MKGRIIIRDLADEDFDPNENLIGTTSFTDYTGLTLTNGIPVSFATDIEEAYKNKVYYIEGVGTAITITPETEIRTFGTWAQEIGAIFDEDGTEGFDTTVIFPLPSICAIDPFGKLYSFNSASVKVLDLSSAVPFCFSTDKIVAGNLPIPSPNAVKAFPTPEPFA